MNQGEEVRSGFIFFGQPSWWYFFLASRKKLLTQEDELATLPAITFHGWLWHHVMPCLYVYPR